MNFTARLIILVSNLSNTFQRFILNPVFKNNVNKKKKNKKTEQTHAHTNSQQFTEIEGHKYKFIILTQI